MAHCFSIWHFYHWKIQKIQALAKSIGSPIVTSLIHFSRMLWMHWCWISHLSSVRFPLVVEFVCYENLNFKKKMRLLLKISNFYLEFWAQFLLENPEKWGISITIFFWFLENRKFERKLLKKCEKIRNFAIFLPKIRYSRSRRDKFMFEKIVCAFTEYCIFTFWNFHQFLKSFSCDLFYQFTMKNWWNFRKVKLQYYLKAHIILHFTEIWICWNFNDFSKYGSEKGRNFQESKNEQFSINFSSNFVYVDEKKTNKKATDQGCRFFWFLKIWKIEKFRFFN